MPSLPWWKTAVIYQVYPRSFCDTTGNGIGDLPGVTSKLDYLARTLGVDAVWLSPFYPSPQADFGYDVSCYTDVDPLFGTLDDFDELLGHAHDLDLKVIIDIVPNHTSDRHPWFVESRRNRSSSKRDWYVWRPPAPGGGPPNNWLSAFGGPSWELDAATGEYYLRSFLPEQPDLNWRNPEVRCALFDVFRFWLDRGVDGFRIDVAHRIMKDPQFADNPPALRNMRTLFRPHGDYDNQLHRNDMGHPDTHVAYRELRTILDSYPGDRFAVGEIHISDWEEWASYYGNDDELHMPYNFQLVWLPWDADRCRRSVDDLEAHVPAFAQPNYVLGNHDDPRLVTRIGEAESRAAAMLLLTLRGTPTIYYGDELGLPAGVIPPSMVQDPWSLRTGLPTRDAARTPMPWTPAAGAGFSEAAPWLPLNEDWRTRNVASQLSDPGSHLNLYRRLLAYRAGSDPLLMGTYKPRGDVPEEVFAYERRVDDRAVLVALNFSGLSAVVDGVAGELAISTHLEWERLRLQGPLELRPHEGVLVEL